MREDWDAEFVALVQENDGVPLANRLRRVMPVAKDGPANIPVNIIYDLAGLFDPRTSSNRFSKPPLYLPVKLTASRVTEPKLNQIKRHGRIWGEVLALIHEGQSLNDAAEAVGEKYRLTGRRVKSIWSAARLAFPMLDLPREAPRKVTRRHIR